MKIAVILGSYSVGARPLDFNVHNIWQSSRGLTGTDLAAIMTSVCLANRGHDVSLFTCHMDSKNKPAIWEKVKLYNYDERLSMINDTFNAIISINEPDVVRGLSEKPLKICWQFLNDFHFCLPEFDKFVDKYLGVSQKQIDHLKKWTPSGEWNLVGLGCSPEWYQDSRVPGRVIWCSSADRGLHWLLQEWPKIKAAVPYASLRIFYHFNFAHVELFEPLAPPPWPNDIPASNVVKEMGNRARYIKNAINRLKPFGVEHVGSVSRDMMKKEFNEASVFAYSCDTLNFSEGFSVSTLEAHASFTVPIITDVDCLGEVYENSGALIVKSPVRDHLSEFSDLVIKSLTDRQFSDQIINKCRAFAAQNTWDIVAEKIEKIIIKKDK